MAGRRGHKVLRVDSNATGSSSSEYPVIINLKVLKEPKLEFPAVSVCNINRMKFEEVKLEVGKGAVAEPLIISERRYNYKTYQSNSNTTKAKNNSLLDFTKKWYQMNVKERFIKGHDPSVFIHKCTWNGKICPKQYLSHFNNLRYGNCVTFNKKKDLMFNFDSSFGNGLQLILDLEPEKYLPITPVVGAVLVIHDPEDTPTPEEKGYIITPGYETFIGLKQSILVRLPAPYKDHCVDYSANFLDNIRNKKECIRKCIQMANYNQCRCIDLTFGILNDLKFCDLSNDTEVQCLNSVLEHMSKIGPMYHKPAPRLTKLETVSRKYIHFGTENLQSEQHKLSA
ncbi:degenerin mec-4-like [Argiope bruennichi]|uniref:degenerin mec-4-like n=1 Tax=Argiope bruennichi TaxID=94029 RepID=UPI0024950031|nr:degenerin mec-4-like [Argiope bruennichi]